MCQCWRIVLSGGLVHPMTCVCVWIKYLESNRFAPLFVCFRFSRILSSITPHLRLEKSNQIKNRFCATLYTNCDALKLNQVRCPDVDKVDKSFFAVVSNIPVVLFQTPVSLSAILSLSFFCCLMLLDVVMLLATNQCRSPKFDRISLSRWCNAPET